MNDKGNHVTREQLDLLAEGELSQPQRKQLFQLLDKTDDGWKRCALALLEAQALAGSMLKIGEPSEQHLVDSDNSVSAKKKESIAKPPRNEYRLATGVLAASVLAILAGWIGWTVGLGQQSFQVSQSNQNRQLSEQQSNELKSSLARLNTGDLKLLAVVEVQSRESNSWVPVIYSQRLQEQVLEHQPIALAPDYVQSANEMGWHISRQQRLLAIEQPEHDTLIMPFETLSYQFVGGKTF